MLGHRVGSRRKHFYISFPSSCSQFDQKQQKSFLRPQKDYWDFLCTALRQQRGNTEPALFVHSQDKVPRAKWQAGWPQDDGVLPPGPWWGSLGARGPRPARGPFLIHPSSTDHRHPPPYNPSRAGPQLSLVLSSAPLQPPFPPIASSPMTPFLMDHPCPLCAG